LNKFTPNPPLRVYPKPGHLSLLRARLWSTKPAGFHVSIREFPGLSGGILRGDGWSPLR